MGAAGLRAEAPMLAPGLLGALHSSHELRVESRDAIPRLTAWLAGQGVAFLPRTAVRGVEPGVVHHAAGTVRARHVVVCPGPDLVTLYPEVMARRGITLCKLHMLRLADPGVRFPAPLMSDLGLVRYLGYQGPRLPALRARLEAEQAAHLADGIHLIAVQHEDGSLVVGDSHVYGDAEDPFANAETEDLIMNEFHKLLKLPKAKIIQRWNGSYASANDVVYKATPSPGVALGVVTGGTGASTSFAFARELLDLAMVN
jgi:FAD dependent oxidoreductase TIGR03364